MQPYLHAALRNVGAIVAFSTVVNLLVLASPLYMLQLYDRVLSSRSLETLLSLTVITTLLLLCMGALDILRGRLLIRVGTRLHDMTAERLFDIVLRRAVTHPREPAREAMKDLNDVRQFIAGPGLIALMDAPWAVAFLALIFMIDSLLGAVALGGAIILLVLAVAAEVTTRDGMREGRTALIRAERHLGGTLRDADAVGVMGMAPRLREIWCAVQDDAVASRDMVSDRLGTLTALSKALRLLLQVAMLGAGAWLVLRQEITPGVMIAASIMMARALAPVEQALGAWRGFASARRGYDRLSALFAAEPETPPATALPTPVARLSVRNLIAAPPGASAPVLKGLGFDVGPGTVLGIIGPSAAGKSTLARVVVGAWPAASGDVRLDGIDASSLQAAGLGRCVGYLPQEVDLLEGTIGENIARFSDAPPDDIVAAARLAGIHDMILRLPDGYDSVVGPGGLVLSGGQKQRVALARAYFGDARLIVLDEPDAHLDEAGRRHLYRSLRHLGEQGRVIIVTTHRPAMTEACDMLLMLRDGRIDLFGPTREVLARLRARGPEMDPDPSGAIAPEAVSA